MSRRPREPRNYSYRTVVDRIREAIDYRQARDVSVYRAVGISKDQWSRKMRVNAKGTGGSRASFTLDEIARIADAMNGPLGWPFVGEQELRQYVRNLEPLALRWIRDDR